MILQYNDLIKCPYCISQAHYVGEGIEDIEFSEMYNCVTCGILQFLYVDIPKVEIDIDAGAIKCRCGENHKVLSKNNDRYLIFCSENHEREGTGTLSIKEMVPAKNISTKKVQPHRNRCYYDVYFKCQNDKCGRAYNHIKGDRLEKDTMVPRKLTSFNQISYCTHCGHEHKNLIESLYVKTAL